MEEVEGVKEGVWVGLSGHMGPGKSMEAGGTGLSPFAVLCPLGSFFPILPLESTAKSRGLDAPFLCVLESQHPESQL